MTELNNSREWEKEHLDDGFVQYPGHPLVNAALIMTLYPSLEEALKPIPGYSYPHALGDGRISGAGCAVHAALDVLKLALTQDTEQAVAEADRYWDGWLAQNPVANQKGWEQGCRQKELIRTVFAEKIKTWGLLTPKKGTV